MRIVIDLQGAQGSGRRRGIGRYSLELALAIARNRREHEVVIALSDLFPETITELRGHFHGILPHSAIRVWTAESTIAWMNPNNDQRRKRAQLIRETFLVSLAPDVVLISSLFEGFSDDIATSIGNLTAVPTAVILYDLIPLISPKMHLQGDRVLNWYMEKIQHLKRADHLLSISSSAAQEVRHHLQWEQHKVTNISAAASGMFQPIEVAVGEATALKAKYGLTRPFLMYTGGIDPRKNIDTLIKAFSKLPAEVKNTHQLAIFSQTSSMQAQRLAELSSSFGLAKSNVVTPGYVPDSDLVRLCNLCKAFVFPSLHEGFGLPALEAMQCGKAVIASNTSSLPEVVGRDDALFDPNDVNAMAFKIEAILNDDAFRRSLELHGLKQAGKFSWDRSARHAIDALSKLHERHKEVSQKEDGIIKLIEALASEHIRDEAMLSLADALAKTFPPALFNSQLFVDVSVSDEGFLEQQKWEEICSILEDLRKVHKDFDIILVRFVTHVGYVPAAELAKKLGEVHQMYSNECPIDVRVGDVFLGLDQYRRNCADADVELDRMRRFGVKIHHIIEAADGRSHC